jgi:hypothetical protein
MEILDNMVAFTDPEDLSELIQGNPEY